MTTPEAYQIAYACQHFLPSKPTAKECNEVIARMQTAFEFDKSVRVMAYQALCSSYGIPENLR